MADANVTARKATGAASGARPRLRVDNVNEFTTRDGVAGARGGECGAAAAKESLIPLDQQPSFAACTGRPLPASTITRTTWRSCAGSAAGTASSNCRVWEAAPAASHAGTGR
jgi:hypothetical protein